MRFEAPAPQKKGEDWTQAEIDTLRAWCIQKPQREYILLSILQRLQRLGFRVSIDDVEELWSDFISKLQIQLQGFKPDKGRAPLTYLIEGCVQAVVGRRRRDQRRKEILRDLHPAEASRFMASPDSDSVERRAIERMDSKRIGQIIDTDLTKEEAAILRMFYMQEMTLTEISQAEGVPVGTIKMRLHRARTRPRSSG